MQILKFFKNPQSHSSKWLFLYVWTPCEIGPQWISYQACHIAFTTCVEGLEDIDPSRVRFGAELPKH